MKKFFAILLLILFFPHIVLANEKPIPLNLEETLKLDNIEIDLGEYKVAENKVNIYLFWGKGCPHCNDFLEFVSNVLVKNYSDYFNFTGYEVWSNKANSELMSKVVNKLDVKEKTGVPFIVIGEEYFVGYGERLNDVLINVLKNEFNKSLKKDVIKEVLSDNLNSEKVDVEDYDKDSDKSDETNDKTIYVNENKSDWLMKMILVLFGVVLGVIAIIILNFTKYKKNRKYKNV